jgi:CDP-paratose 2-epimerase
MWWISDVSKFQGHYPEWRFSYNIQGILEEIFAVQKKVVAS